VETNINKNWLQVQLQAATNMEGGDQKRVGDHCQGRTAAGRYTREIILGFFDSPVVKTNENIKRPLGIFPRAFFLFLT